MKRMNNLFKYAAFTLTLSIIVFACGEDEVVEPPLAFFEAAASEADNLTWDFTNGSQDADSYSWDFGDGSDLVTDMSPSHTFSTAGEYIVTLTATNEGGDHQYSETINVTANDPVNVLVNGTLDDDSGWTVIQHNANNNGSITFADGVAVFNEVTDVAEGDWGGIWAHVGMYQAVEVQAGTYTVDLDIVTEGINETWLEVWIGQNEPTAEIDYNGDVGADRALMANAWDCENTRSYSGSLAATSCGDHDGTFTFEAAGTYYFVVRGGGFNFGPNGITIDNITLEK